MATKLAPGQISDLDPHKFMAVIGKRVIRPGGRAPAEALLRQAQITGSARVLDVGCGVATTAIQIARRYGTQVTAADISPLMLGARRGQRPGRGPRRPGQGHVRRHPGAAVR